MTITSAFVNSFKLELAALTPHAPGDVFKALLIKTVHAGTYDKNITNVGTPGTGTPSTSNVGTDAVAVSGDYNSVDGITLAGFSAVLDGDVSYITFTDPAALAGTTISADGMIIYNSTRGGRVCAVYAFASAPRISTGGPFDINLPAAAGATALIRIGA